MSFIEDAGEIQLGRQSFNSFNTAIESETTDKIKSAKLNQAMENEAKNFIDDNEMTNIMRGNGKQQGKKRKQGGGKTPPKKSKT